LHEHKHDVTPQEDVDIHRRNFSDNFWYAVSSEHALIAMDL